MLGFSERRPTSIPFGLTLRLLISFGSALFNVSVIFLLHKCQTATGHTEIPLFGLGWRVWYTCHEVGNGYGGEISGFNMPICFWRVLQLTPFKFPIFLTHFRGVYVTSWLNENQLFYQQSFGNFLRIYLFLLFFSWVPWLRPLSHSKDVLCNTPPVGF